MTACTNEQRIHAARFALASHLWAKGDSPLDPVDLVSVIDLLADLRHFCQAMVIDYAKCDRLAAGHFEAEEAEAARRLS